jgi:hypothetical protein
MRAHVEHLDGNALAGVLVELMNGDASTLTITCRHCGRHGEMGDVIVERDEVASIVRCRGCEHTLLVILRDAEGGIRLRFEGAAEISSA